MAKPPHFEACVNTASGGCVDAYVLNDNENTNLRSFVIQFLAAKLAKKNK